MTQTEIRSVAPTLGLRAGDVVEVKSAEEIIATLDERGELENLPFMPEMLAFCGRRMTVHKVALKVCDAMNWTGMHKMTRAVHLTGSRCDGSAHGGCQTACSLFWKEAWLQGRPFRAGDAAAPLATTAGRPSVPSNQHHEGPGPERRRYSCQATEILRAAPARYRSPRRPVRHRRARECRSLLRRSRLSRRRLQPAARKHAQASGPAAVP